MSLAPNPSTLAPSKALRLAPDHFWAKALVVWYGLYQAGHFVFNALYLLQPGTPPFPPPAEGWLPQTVHFLNGMAASDLVNAVLSLVFVYGYFTRARWRMWLGTLTLTVSMYAAVVFTYGTVATGTWAGNLLGYLWFYVPFLPVVALFILVNVWVARGMGELPMDKGAEYIPALGYDWLTPLYDPLLRWVMREEKFKRDLIAQARLEAGHRVLDLGCGTATLTILAKQLHPDATVVGLDGDPRVLEIGRTKAAKAGTNITLDQGMAFQLPYPDGSFDRVLSSLVFHHLTTEDKRRALREVFRVLRPGGELHIFDFGRPHTVLARWIAPAVRRLERTADLIDGLLPDMFRRAGFGEAQETAHFMTLVGTLSLYRAQRPD